LESGVKNFGVISCYKSFTFLLRCFFIGSVVRSGSAGRGVEGRTVTDSGFYIITLSEMNGPGSSADAVISLIMVKPQKK
jgi:hypothetical protein